MGGLLDRDHYPGNLLDLLESLISRIAGLERRLSGGGSGSGATTMSPSAPDVSGEPFVVTSARLALSAERVLTEGLGIDLTDAGAGSTLTVDVDPLELITFQDTEPVPTWAGQVWLATETDRQSVTLSTLGLRASVPDIRQTMPNKAQTVDLDCLAVSTEILTTETSPPTPVTCAAGGISQTGVGTASNGVTQIVVSYLGGNQWQAVITNLSGGTTIGGISFPYAQPIDLDDGAEDMSDGVIYYPYRSGRVFRRSDFAGYGGLKYPTSCTAPILVADDNDRALIVAATNLDSSVGLTPKYVRLNATKDSFTLAYDETIGPGENSTFRCLVATASCTSGGTYDFKQERAWQLVVDKYKDWLRSALDDAGLYVDEEPPYPSWIKSIDGWINVQLQNKTDSTWEDYIEDLWDAYGDDLPWVQVWGQMSAYAGGCCSMSRTLHSRYDPEIQALATAIQAASGHFGYYSRPLRLENGTRPTLESTTRHSDYDANNETAMEYLLEWLDRHVEWDANAHYIDEIGAVTIVDDPWNLVQYFTDDTFPEDLVIEFGSDVYLVSSLFAGSFTNNTTNYGPDVTLNDRNEILFPYFMAYLLSDRILFYGCSNGDYRLWGANHDYWIERQVFLMGQRFDAMYPNEYVSQVVEERARVNWYTREPEYQNTKGLTEVPANVTISRFIDSNGDDLCAIDNWNELNSVTFRVDGVQHVVTIPGSTRVYIYEVP